MKICFLGTPSFGLPSLEYLANNTDLACVVVRPEKSKMRSPIKTYALEHNIKLFEPNRLDDILDELLTLGVEVLVTAAYGEIISDRVLNSFPFKLNLHGSILPERRGAAPIQRAMMEGDTVLGVSLIEMTAKMDAGRVYGIKSIERDFNKSFTEVYEDLAVVARDVLRENLDAILSSKNKGVLQDEAKATYTKKIKNKEEEINFNNSAFLIFLQIKAFAERPGAFFLYNGVKFKVFNAVVTNLKSDSTDPIFIFQKKLYLKASDYLLEILEIQKEGKKRLRASDFLNGQTLFSKRDSL